MNIKYLNIIQLVEVKKSSMYNTFVMMFYFF